MRKKPSIRPLSTAVLAAFVASGCTQFISTKEQEQAVHSMVQRSIYDRGVEFEAYVYGKEHDQKVQAEDRVVWLQGVDVSNSKLQRGSERKIPETDTQENPDENLVRSYVLELAGDDLSVQGKMALNNFKAQNKDRFYVEFLSRSEMQEESVRQPIEAWQKIMPLLQLNGLNPAHVVMGGAKYKQKSNAIVLVKIGG